MIKEHEYPKLEALTLVSVCEGAAEQMFQDELTATEEVFESPHDWADAYGKIVVKVNVAVTFVYDTETQTVQAEVSSSLKRPARRAVRRPVHRGHDGWSAVTEARQRTFDDHVEEGE